MTEIEISPHARQQMAERGANEMEVEAAMRIAYDPSVDALYIRLVEGLVQCEVIRLNDRVAVNIGPGEQVVGIEILDASEVLEGLRERKVYLENLTAAS